MGATSPKRGKRAGRGKRAVLCALAGLVVLVLACGGGFYLWYQSEVGDSNARVDPEVLEALDEGVDLMTPTTAAGDAGPSVSSTEKPPDPPTGMNLVLIGSDTRATDGKGGRSDTIILVHVDPENDFLSLLSVPRDLKVEVPGHGTRKINTAYAYGGPALLIRTVQSVLGVDLDHYAEVDFGAFKEITDTLGGVYVDVDRAYADGAIRLEPGYQLLDGQNALRFCRTRHDSNIDFGRMARQQRFLCAVREQAMGWNLAFKLPSLISSIFDHVDTDLTAEEILDLAYWAVKLDGSRMKTASIISTTGTIDGVSYVLASNDQLQGAVADFLSAPAEAAGPEVPAQGAAGLLPPGTAAAVPDADAWRALAGAAGFPLMAPTYLPDKCRYSYQRSYAIQTGDGPLPAVRMGYRLGRKDQYLGVSQTTWLEAPIASPGVQVRQGTVVFTVVGTSAKTDHVWWVEEGVLHWVSNTLLCELTREQLLAVALSCVPVR